MKLEEVLKSNRPFKLPGGYWLIAAGGQITEEGTGRVVSFYRPQEMLSNEWQIKEPETFLTRSHFEKIWDRIGNENKGKNITRDDLFKILCEELGLRKDLK